ncbi:MAG: RagB/SusD family nutrient uptake outer membrane protein, partial [Sphingobacteriales bacterium]
ESQLNEGLVSVYDLLRKNSGGFDNMVTFFNAGSDDFFAGGGGPTDGVGIHSFDNFTLSATSIPRSFFGDFYRGVARANILILKLPDATADEAVKARILAEARTLRAYYYFNLVTMFKNVPLILEPVETNALFDIPQNTPAEVYAFIESELLASINDIPGTVPDEQDGRLTQAAAKAILGKVYLYQGKWAEAAAQLADVNGTPGAVTQYGNQLLGNFNDLWLVDNKFNSESILEASHTNLSRAGWGNWGTSSDEGNSVNQMVGPRGYNRTNPNVAPDVISGWAFNPVTPSLRDAMVGDPRYNATILDMPALIAGGAADYAPADQDTGYFLRKFIPKPSETSNLGGNTELNYRQNSYLIRLADTYLMEAEALVQTGNTARAQQLLDAVRSRVGLPSVPVSPETIYNERRLELAGEGHRFFDLVRTNRTTLLTPFGFTPGKNEVLPIPFEDIANTILVQNSGY